MSCNICHTPILVHPPFLNAAAMDQVTQTDHLLPIVKEVCPTSHQSYFRNMVQLDRKLEGIVLQDPVHMGRGVFCGTIWKIADGGMANTLFQEEIRDGVTVNCVYHSFSLLIGV